jgi:single-strand DNA-binding protein
MSCTITVTGNVGRDPEYGMTKSGATMLKFSIASNRKEQGEDITTWFNVTVFGQNADFWKDKLHKGDKALAIGRFSVRSYAKQDGSNGVSYDIVANEIEGLTDHRTADTGTDEDVPF